MKAKELLIQHKGGDSDGRKRYNDCEIYAAK